MNIEIRKLPPDQSDRLREMLDIEPQWFIALPGIIDSLQEDQGNQTVCYAAFDGPRIVGFVYSFIVCHKTLIPQLMVVSPDHRKSGIGKRLIAALEDGSGCSASLIYYHHDLRDYYASQGYMVGTEVEVAMKELGGNK